MHVLWLKTELLHPVDKGGRIRTYHTLRALKRQHRVTYLTLDDGMAAADARERAAEYCDELITVQFAPPAKRSLAYFAALAANAWSRLPYAVSRYRSSEMEAKLAALVSSGRVDLVICDFLAPSVNVPAAIGVPTVLFQHNVESAIWARHARVARSPVIRSYFAMQWKRMCAFERHECARYDRVIAVSAADRDAFARDFGAHDVVAVPTGVDVDFFRPSGNGRRVPGHIVFTGSMDWMPNEEGCEWFVNEVLPLVRRAVPSVRLSIVGRHPTPRVRALAGRDPSVTVTGDVPDVRPYLESASTFIVPLRVGGGTRLKIFEAMAMETPVVSTTVGAEGLPVRDGQHLRIADDPVAFAWAVVHYLQHPDEGRGDALAAAQLVRSQFSWEEAGAAFVRYCEEVAGVAGIDAKRRRVPTPVR